MIREISEEVKVEPEAIPCSEHNLRKGIPRTKQHHKNLLARNVCAVFQDRDTQPRNVIVTVPDPLFAESMYCLLIRTPAAVAA